MRQRLSRPRRPFPTTPASLKFTAPVSTENHNFDNDLSDLNIDDVRSKNDEPFQHSAGFIRLNLKHDNSLRMNIWPESPDYVSSNIHDHIASLHSRIICGALIHTPFLYDWNQQKGSHEMIVVHRPPAETLEKTGLFFNLLKQPGQLVKPGEEYRLAAFIPHQVSHRQLTATINRKVKNNPESQPLILVPKGGEINPQNIPQLTQRQMWELIAEVIDNAKFSRKSEPAPKPH